MLDTIVIGAGWAGVIAARDIASKGHSVLVLEARDRIGGRARTYTEGMYAPVDLGCSWIHGYKEGNPVREIAATAGIKAFLPKPTDSVIYGPEGPLSSAIASQLRSNLSSARAAAKSFAQSGISASDTARALSEFFFSPTSPLLSASAENSLAKAFARSLEIPFGASLENVSLQWAGWEDAFAGSDAAPDGGYQPLVATILDIARKAGAVVKIQENVQSLEQVPDGVTVRSDKGEYTARSVVCTIPLGVLQRTPPAFTPPLPPRRREIIARTHVGVLEKLVLAYPSAWWPDAASVGAFTFLPTQSVPNDGSSDAQAVFESHTIVVASSATPALPTSHPTLLFYLSPAPARQLAKFSQLDLTRAAHAFLIARFRPAVPPPPPHASMHTDWVGDPFACGATTTPVLVGEGRSPLDFVELGKPLWEGRLGFAGEHTDADHRGSVAGAVVSGQREAARVSRLLAKVKEG